MKTESLSSLKKIFAASLTFILLICGGTAAHAQTKASTLLGYIVIPDAGKTLEQFDKIAGTIDPERFKPGSFKMQVGMMLGDPALENIDRTKPSVIMFFYNPSNEKNAQKGVNDLAVAVLLPTKDKTLYKRTFDAMGLANETNGDIAIISNKKTSLTCAQREMKLYRKIAAQTTACDVRVLMKIDSIMSVYNTEITMLMKQMQALTSGSTETSGLNEQQASFLSIGKIIIYVMLDLTAQSKDYQMDLSFNEKSILISSEHSTIPGSALSRFFDGNAPAANKCLALLPEKDQLTYAGYFDMKRFRDLVDNLLAEAIKRDPSLKKDINEALLDAYRKYTELYLGEFAVTYGFDNNGQLQMHLAAATDKTNDDFFAANEKFMTIYKETMSKVGGDAAGFSDYNVQKNFRKSGGVDVHRYVVKMDSSKLKDDEKAMMQKMFGKEFTTEYAVANGFIVASTSPKILDKIIANTISGGGKIELLSMKAFGTGMDSYVDFDVVSFFEKIYEQTVSMKAGEKNPDADKTMSMLKKLRLEDRTILSSSKYSKGSSFNKYQISMKMITDIAKFVNEQKKQSMIQEQSVEIPSESENE